MYVKHPLGAFIFIGKDQRQAVCESLKILFQFVWTIQAAGLKILVNTISNYKEDIKGLI